MVKYYMALKIISVPVSNDGQCLYTETLCSCGEKRFHCLVLIVPIEIGAAVF